jgi:RsiW-degrading membrane proteinase PrsW (M82 family)
MPISVTCACGKKLKAPDSAAGKRSKCPACGQPVTVPTLEESAAYTLLDDSVAPHSEADPAPPAEPVVRRPARPKHPPDPKPRPSVQSPTGAGRPRSSLPQTASQRSFVLDHLHWLFCLALIPLVISLLQTGDESNTADRIQQAFSQLSPEQQARLVTRVLQHRPQRADDEETEIDPSELKHDLFEMLPEKRLDGAMLPYDSELHWLWAVVAAIVFLAFIILIATEAVNPLQLLGIGLFTGTVGVLMLLAVQAIADWTQDYIVIGRGVITIVFWVLKFIGFSYRAAMGDTGFFLSFMGFTLGVGFCEELCKALPVLFRFWRRPSLTWRGAMFWGLASGAGFGIAEGVIYSGSFYNGIAPTGMYAIRFISCVALHALWTGSVAIMIYRHHGLFDQAANWVERVPPLFLVLGISMLLHGLYDTMLKKEMNALALIVALASFAWFAWQVRRMSAVEEEDSEKVPARRLRTA